MIEIIVRLGCGLFLLLALFHTIWMFWSME